MEFSFLEKLKKTTFYMSINNYNKIDFLYMRLIILE
jgi:hypothetical protein